MRAFPAVHCETFDDLITAVTSSSKDYHAPQQMDAGCHKAGASSPYVKAALSPVSGQVPYMHHAPSCTVSKPVCIALLQVWDKLNMQDLQRMTGAIENQRVK